MDDHPPPHALHDTFNPRFVYRALPYDDLLNRTGKHRDNTFFRHLTRDTHGMSVTTSIASCKAQFDRPIFGIRRVDVAAVRQYGLEVFPTSPTHANIRFANGTNVPATREDDTLARDIAAALMRMSVPIEHWNADDADEIEAAYLNGL